MKWCETKLPDSTLLNPKKIYKNENDTLYLINLKCSVLKKPQLKKEKKGGGRGCGIFFWSEYLTDSIKIKHEQGENQLCLEAVAIAAYPLLNIGGI